LIDGVNVTRPAQFHDQRGSVFQMLREDSDTFIRFGEVYFSVVHPNIIKGWYQHERMTINLATISGTVKLVLFDDRSGSLSSGEILELELSLSNYQLVTIPPKIWYGFQAIGSESAILANCSTLPHSMEEMRKKNPQSQSVPYSWDEKTMGEAQI
jgi:dTDP-4-dehydrorhamnose 3,5-epimerase